MVKERCRDGAPDDAFTHWLAEAIRVFGSRGPATCHILSTWHDRLRDQTRAILAAGAEGLRIDTALAHSGSARQRYHAATRFGLRRDERSLDELERLMEDRSARVRRQATRWYAGRIHPTRHGPFDSRAAAETAAEGLDRLIARMRDENHNVRLTAVHMVAAYADAASEATAALRRALEDPKHKVRHAAARALGVACPGCGRRYA